MCAGVFIAERGPERERARGGPERMGTRRTGGTAASGLDEGERGPHALQGRDSREVVGVAYKSVAHG